MESILPGEMMLLYEGQNLHRTTISNMPAAQIPLTAVSECVCADGNVQLLAAGVCAAAQHHRSKTGEWERTKQQTTNVSERLLMTKVV